MGSIRRSITILAAAATVAGTHRWPDQLPRPNRRGVQDISTAVKVVAVDGNRKLEVSVERSENAGAFAYARPHGGPAVDSLAEGESRRDVEDAHLANTIVDIHALSRCS